MPISILFVDDEPNVINGLKRMLFSMRNEWEISFANSGEDALNKMNSGSIDVIVTDMKMPQMNGSQLLEIVMKKFPTTVRIILSGQYDNEVEIKSSNIAHQFIEKPCNAEVLKSEIFRTLNLIKNRNNSIIVKLPIEDKN